MNCLRNDSKDTTRAPYGDTTWLRALVTAIPYIGGSLGLIFSGRGQRVARGRIEQMLSHLEERDA
jgi:hypothetical protein